MKRCLFFSGFTVLLILVGCVENGSVSNSDEPELTRAQVDEWNAGRQPVRSELPSDAQEYMRIIETNSEHPHIKQHFHQLTLCFMQGPKEPVPFFLMEFRDKLNAGMVWTDSEGNWGTGGWLPLESEQATLEVDISYLQGSPAYPNCLAAIDALMKMDRAK